MLGQGRPGEQWELKDSPHSPKFLDWSLNIRWFNVISGALDGSKGSYLALEMQLVYSTAQAD